MEGVGEGAGVDVGAGRVKVAGGWWWRWWVLEYLSCCRRSVKT